MNRERQETADVSPSTEEIEKQADYVNAPGCVAQQTPVISDGSPPSFWSSVGLLVVCWGILSVIMGLRIYFSSLIIEDNTKLRDNQTALLANQDLTNLVNNLSSANQNLANLMDNLNRDYDILQSKNKHLTTENQQLKIQIEIKHREKNDLDLTRAQWSLDAYCRKEGDSQERVCQRCEKDWELFQSSCYVILDYHDVSERRTWEEARNHCRGRSADLVVIESPDEQGFIFDKSFGSTNKTSGYWIGLSGTTEAGWRWVDGRDLTTEYWVGDPPVSGGCAISFQQSKPKGWSAVDCDLKHRWICEKKALSV